MWKKRAARYHDKWGPTVLCLLLLICVGVNFAMKMGGTKKHPGIIPLPGKGKLGGGAGAELEGVNGYGRWSGIH